MGKFKQAYLNLVLHCRNRRQGTERLDFGSQVHVVSMLCNIFDQHPVYDAINNVEGLRVLESLSCFCRLSVTARFSHLQTN